MPSEQEKILQALQLAIEMEIDGKECYLEMSQQSGNEVGRKLLQSLAEEEDVHQQKLQEIYEAIRNKKAWPVIDFRPGRIDKLRNTFIRSCEVLGVNVYGGVSDFDAIKTAVEKEKNSYDFYNRQSGAATSDAEREFYRAVATEERQHELFLLDYYEYLTDPAGFFVKTEHPSLDGG